MPASDTRTSPPRDGGRLLSVADVAELIGVSPATWRAYVSHGQAPPPDLRLGRSPGWYVSTVERWHAARRGQGWRRNEQAPPSPA